MAAQVANWFDPATNIDLGTKYLRPMLDPASGDEKLALIKYNSGPNAGGSTIPAGPDHSAETYSQKVKANL